MQTREKHKKQIPGVPNLCTHSLYNWSSSSCSSSHQNWLKQNRELIGLRNRAGQGSVSGCWQLKPAFLPAVGLRLHFCGVLPAWPHRLALILPSGCPLLRAEMAEAVPVMRLHGTNQRKAGQLFQLLSRKRWKAFFPFPSRSFLKNLASHGSELSWVPIPDPNMDVGFAHIRQDSPGSPGRVNFSLSTSGLHGESMGTWWKLQNCSHKEKGVDWVFWVF